jgi:hypothetical protein
LVNGQLRLSNVDRRSLSRHKTLDTNMSKSKRDHYKTFARSTFKCVVCGKKVTLPAWGIKRKYCSMACSQSIQMARAAKKHKQQKRAKKAKS